MRIIAIIQEVYGHQSLYDSFYYLHALRWIPHESEDSEGVSWKFIHYTRLSPARKNTSKWSELIDTLRNHGFISFGKGKLAKRPFP